MLSECYRCCCHRHRIRHRCGGGAVERNSAFAIFASRFIQTDFIPIRSKRTKTNEYYELRFRLLLVIERTLLGRALNVKSL